MAEDPLIDASRDGLLPQVLALLGNGHSISVTDKTFSREPLAWASRQGHTEIVKILLEHGANANAIDGYGLSPLQCASSFGHTPTVIALCKFNAEINKQDKEGWTALMMAAAHGHEQAVAALIDLGANINSVQAQGLNALELAKSRKFPAIIELLIQS